MPDRDKLDQIRELYKSLSPDEKGKFAADLADDEDLMATLLDYLVQRHQTADNPEFGSTDTFIDFLRRVKE